VAPTIVFEHHATSLDNEAGLASGRSDVPLSAVGERQAVELGARHAGTRLDVVFSSDLQRARRTAELAFAARGLPIACDERLREIDYGQLTCYPRAMIEAARLRHVDTPFPGGESYREATERHARFLAALAQRLPRGRVLVIGHYATLVAFEHLLRGRPLAEILAAAMPWQPGREYRDDR